MRIIVYLCESAVAFIVYYQHFQKVRLLRSIQEYSYRPRIGLFEAGETLLNVKSAAFTLTEFSWEEMRFIVVEWGCKNGP